MIPLAFLAVFLSGLLIGLWFGGRIVLDMVTGGLYYAMRQGWLSYSQLTLILEQMAEGEDG